MYETKFDLSAATRTNVVKFPKKILAVYSARPVYEPFSSAGPCRAGVVHPDH
jgi:hypothetical protein